MGSRYNVAANDASYWSLNVSGNSHVSWKYHGTASIYAAMHLPLTHISKVVNVWNGKMINWNMTHVKNNFI